jgi:hypothetical protein
MTPESVVSSKDGTGEAMACGCGVAAAALAALIVAAC